MPEEHIYLFYGFSGSQRQPTPDFERGQDYDRLFELAANTMSRVAKLSHPGAKVFVIRSWTQNSILDFLGQPATYTYRIRQVHVFCHGVSAMLSLAYEYDRLKRIRTRATKFNEMAREKGDTFAAMRAFREEDALVAGSLRNAWGDSLARVKRIRERMLMTPHGRFGAATQGRRSPILTIGTP
jgi:hypothetical protein